MDMTSMQVAKFMELNLIVEMFCVGAGLILEQRNEMHLVYEL